MSDQQAYAQPGYEQPPKKSHCLRNCLLLGCFLIVLAGVGGGIFAWLAVRSSKLQPVQGAQAVSLGQELAKGATVPASYDVNGFDMVAPFGLAKAKMVVAAPKGANQPGKPPAATILMWGACAPRPSSLDEIRAALEKQMQQQGGGGGGVGAGAERSEEELDIGKDGQKVKAIRLVAVDQQHGTKLVEYFVLIDNLDNDFGWLGIMALGPDGVFDVEVLKSFLATIDVKKSPAPPEKK